MSDGSIHLGFLKCSSEPYDLNNQVSRLQALLENNSFAIDVEQLLQVLKPCLSMCMTESLDEQIFSKILPKAHHLLSKILKDIDDTITDNNMNIKDLDNVKRKLYAINGLLAFWEKCLECISVLKKIRACYVITLCDILPETIKIIFKHCKASSKYGVLLNGSLEELKNLFAKASSIFKLFFTTLDGIIIFDMDVQSETKLLMKVINAYGDVVSIANGMDTKTFVELTEAFAKLVIIHKNNLKLCNMTIYLDQIANSISYFLSINKNQKSNMNRTVMAITRLLKILEKLMTIYDTLLTYQTISSVVELLAQIHGYLYLNLAMDGRKTLPISILAAFLDIIFNHNDFKQVYFEYGKQIASHSTYEHRLNYQLLTIAIMKKLNHMPYEYLYKWCLDLDSILDVAFTYIEYCEGEIYAKESRSDYKIGERPQLVNIYEATLVPICDLIIQITPEDFYMIELLLLKYLLSGYLWSSLLSSDVWYFITKLSTSQLCANHIKYLIKISAVLRERSVSIEAIMVDYTIIGLYELLTADAKSALLRDLVDLDILNHSASIVHFLTIENKTFQSKLFQHVKDLSKIFSNLQEYPSVYNWKHLIQILSSLTVDYSDNKYIIDILPKLWSFVRDTITECESKQLDILSNLIIILLNITSFKNFQDNVFYLILTSIEISCVCLLSHGKVEICQFLQKCVKDFDQCTVQSIALNLTKLFSHLLRTESPWVRQETLETFEYIGHMCTEQLVAEIARILAKISDINNIMQAYLSSKPCYTLTGFADIQNYFKHLVKAFQDCRNKHVCYSYNEFEREKKMPRLEKMESLQNIIIPVSIQLDKRAEELYEVLTKVLKGQATINNTICKKLIIILKKILDISEK